jgi:hypothetical protein
MVFSCSEIFKKKYKKICLHFIRKMEVPAKRLRLAPRELKLLDLDDDVLMMIIKKLNHKSKKQMMATCKRLEGLIGQTHQFFKNFKFRYNRRRFPDFRYLSMVRRNFGTVEILGVDELSPSILKFLYKIGAHIQKIRFNNTMFENSSFFELMKALPKIEELEIKDSAFERSYPGEISVDFKSEHLTKLDISCSLKLNVFAAFVPSSLKILRLKARDLNWKDCWDAEVLGKQTKLEELCLENFTANEFNFDPENCHIEKLEIRSLRFLDKSAFEKFSNFMKIQKSVKELEVHHGEEEFKIGDFTGILAHLFSLKTLKKVTIGCEYNKEIFKVLSKIQVSNPSVDTLTILKVPSGADLKQASFPRLFPNAKDIKITQYTMTTIAYSIDIFDC